jgi:hypothetical protein
VKMSSLMRHLTQSMSLPEAEIVKWFGAPNPCLWPADAWQGVDYLVSLIEVLVGLLPASQAQFMHKRRPDSAYEMSLITTLGAWLGSRHYCLARADHILGRAG